MSANTAVSEARIPVIYSRIILSALGRSEAERRLLLQDLTRNDGSGTIDCTQYAALLRTARQVSGDALIALKAGANIPFSVHGPLGIAAMSSATLADALDVVTRYATLRSPFCRMLIDSDGDQARLRFVMAPVLEDQTEPALDFILSTLCRSIVTLLPQPAPALRVQLRRPRPPQAMQYQHILGCAVQFDADDDAVTVDRAALATPLNGANREEYDEAVSRLRLLLAPIDAARPLRERLMQVFATRSGHLCSLAESASALHLSSRSLQRHLQTQGLSFNALRDEWLGRQALSYLRRERLSVETTATLLGYSDIANFRRSFRRWFGLPPSQLRTAPDGAI